MESLLPSGGGHGGGVADNVHETQESRPVDSPDPPRGCRGRAGRANSRKTWSRARSEVFVPEGCIYCDQRPDQPILQTLLGLAKPENEPGRPPSSWRLAARPSTLSTVRILSPDRFPRLGGDAFPRCHPKMSHGVRCGRTMFTKQVSPPIGRSGFPVMAAEAEQVERTRRKTWSRPRSEVLVLYRRTRGYRASRARPGSSDSPTLGCPSPSGG